MTKLLVSILSFIIFIGLQAQSDQDAQMIKSIHDNILTDGDCYDWLYHLSEKIGGRLAGSPESEEAIAYTSEILSAFADTVYKQECQVPY